MSERMTLLYVVCVVFIKNIGELGMFVSCVPTWKTNVKDIVYLK